MPSRRPRRPSPALVIALLSLFISLGGVTWAATQLPRDSVGSAQIRNGSITGADVKDGSLAATDLRAGAVPTGTGAAGPAGAAGSAGAAGAPGAPGLKGDAGQKGDPGSLPASLEGVACNVPGMPGYSGTTKVVKWTAGIMVVGCSKTVMAPVMGNGVLENNEQCDDGNTAATDGCSPTGVLERPAP